MKVKTIYTCQECQQESPKWIGQCPSCNAWNSFSEKQITKLSKVIESRRAHRNIDAKTPQALKINASTKQDRLKTGIIELDRTMGGGFVHDSATLLSGEPGIGKSTLTLQITSILANQGQKTIYISGEESLNQVAERAKRLKLNSERALFLQENNLETIISTIEKEKPNFLIIDSIQTISSLDSSSSPGSISQTITATERLIEHCKKHQITLLLIGHVTKDGQLAGPKMLEHLVDTVLMLEGDRQHQYRILRTSKNRFGSTSEIGIFSMSEIGLLEIENPSEEFMRTRPKNAIGSAFTVTLEGNRPLLVEIQALTSATPFGYPKRTSHGFDLTRLHIITAILEKFTKIKLKEQDIFVNVVGGLKLKDPAADLAVALAIYSSYYKIKIPASLVAIGELGLTGEIREAYNMDQRVKDLKKLGIEQIISSDKLKDKTLERALEIALQNQA